MKYFSISFLPDVNDVPKQKAAFNLNFLSDPAAKKRIIFTILCTVFMFMMGDISLAMLVSFIAVPNVASAVYSKSYIKSVYKSRLIKRQSTIDFYADHLVYTLERNEDFKGISERHMGFDKLERIFDFENVFVFAFKNEGGLTIPKRAMNPEQVDMIYNLIDNLFKHKYVKVK